MSKPFKINLSPKDLYACGRVAIWTAMLDTTMEVAIWVLLDLPKFQARRMTHGTQAARKRELLTFLSESTTISPKERQELRAILEEIEQALIERNRVIHGLWHIGPDDKPWVAKYNEKGGLTFHGLLDEPLVQPVADTAKKLAVRLARWIEKRDPSALVSAFPKISASTKPVNPTKAARPRP